MDALGNCLERALALVRGDRGRDYGRPRDDYGRTAALWSAYLGVPVTAEQAAVCMILVKVSRLAHSPGHADSIIDIAGYAAVVEDCADAARTAARPQERPGKVKDAEFDLGDGKKIAHYSSRPDAVPLRSKPTINPFVRLSRVATILRDAVGTVPGETVEGAAQRAASLVRPGYEPAKAVLFASVAPREGMCGVVSPKDSTVAWLVEYRNGEWLTAESAQNVAQTGDRFCPFNWRSIFEGGTS